MALIPLRMLWLSGAAMCLLASGAVAQGTGTAPSQPPGARNQRTGTRRGSDPAYAGAA